MNNADKFKQIFDLYATELWAMSEKDFLAWLNVERDVPDANVGESISRQAALDAITDDSIVANMDSVYDSELHRYKRAMHRIIANLPSIDTVKHGKWIKMSDADGVYWACSECGEDLPRVSHFNPQFDLFPRIESIDRTHFCPKCGVKMDGERSEE